MHSYSKRSCIKDYCPTNTDLISIAPYFIYRRSHTETSGPVNAGLGVSFSSGPPSVSIKSSKATSKSD